MKENMNNISMMLFIVMVSIIFFYIQQVNADALPKPSVTKVVLLGTGTPNAEPDRSGSAVAIVVNDTPYLIDFGPGVVRRAMAAKEKGIDALNAKNIRYVFATHLHSDHTAGYSDLILTPWVLGRSEPLEVYGPEGIKEMTKHILLAYQKDISVRLSGSHQPPPEGYKVNAHEIKAGVIFEDSNVKVEAFSVRHGSWENNNAFGYKFQTPDKTIVISGDTVPCESLVAAAKGCDILIHEVYSVSAFENLKPGRQQYHGDSHTSSKELAKIAKKVQPGLLILYHQLLWGASEDDLLKEIQQDYKGKVVYGKDLDIF